MRIRPCLDSASCQLVDGRWLLLKKSTPLGYRSAAPLGSTQTQLATTLPHAPDQPAITEAALYLNERHDAQVERRPRGKAPER